MLEAYRVRSLQRRRASGNEALAMALRNGIAGGILMSQWERGEIKRWRRAWNRSPRGAVASGGNWDAYG